MPTHAQLLFLRSERGADFRFERKAEATQQLLLCPERTILAQLRAGMDGALVYHCDPRSPALGWLQKRRLPLVYVDQYAEPDVPSVNVDDRGGARAAAEHLIGLGHRRIGIVTAGSL